MALRSLKTQMLTVLAAGAQGTFPLPANCVRLEIRNLSGSPIRYTTNTGIVNANPLSLPYQFSVLEAGGFVPEKIVIPSGSLFFAGNIGGGQIAVTPFVKG